MPDSAPGLEPWSASDATFKVDGGAGTSVPSSAAGDLDRFEAEIGLRLPAGFRGFLRVSGPGDLFADREKALREKLVRSPY